MTLWIRKVCLPKTNLQYGLLWHKLTETTTIGRNFKFLKKLMNAMQGSTIHKIKRKA